MSLFPEQVLSESVSKAWVLTGGQEAQGTATFVSMLDKFFDLLNVSRYRKPFHHPYRNSDDVRLKVSLYAT